VRSPTPHPPCAGEGRNCGRTDLVDLTRHKVIRRASAPAQQSGTVTHMPNLELDDDPQVLWIAGHCVALSHDLPIGTRYRPNADARVRRWSGRRIGYRLKNRPVLVVRWPDGSRPLPDPAPPRDTAGNENAPTTPVRRPSPTQGTRVGEGRESGLVLLSVAPEGEGTSS
jgi:hypothetical protein